VSIGDCVVVTAACGKVVAGTAVAGSDTCVGLKTTTTSTERFITSKPISGHNHRGVALSLVPTGTSEISGAFCRCRSDSDFFNASKIKDILSFQIPKTLFGH
jgi:hypothetical protein